jgi:DNA polymerase-3 subunit gamma/tau
VRTPDPELSPAPVVAAPPPPPSEEVSAEDEVLDAAHNAEELLSSTFGAEVIAVRDAE